MHIELSKATLEEKSLVHNLSQFYLYEFSNYLPAIQLEADGLYTGLPNLDTYWNDPNREAFIVRVNEELAGFVLVIKGVDDEPSEIGEFFIMSKFGGKGVGKTIAIKIFELFPGNWLVHQMWNNYRAQAFWRSVIRAYTDGQYHEYYDEQRRPFQKFSNHRSEVTGEG